MTAPKHSDITDLCEHIAQCLAKQIVSRTMQIVAEQLADQDDSESLAKATKGKAGTAGVNGPVRRSTAGTGLRVGEADADQSATSEIMDVTAGETAPNSRDGASEVPVSGTPPTAEMGSRAVTAGETAPNSSASSHEKHRPDASDDFPGTDPETSTSRGRKMAGVVPNRGVTGGESAATKLQSALDPATGADAATAPDITDPPVAVAVNNSCGIAEGRDPEGTVSVAASGLRERHPRDMEAAGSQCEAEAGLPSEMARAMEQASNRTSQDSDHIAGPAAARDRAGVESCPQEPIEPLNPFIPMDRLETSTVQPDSGAVLDSEHDGARPEQAPSSQGRASFPSGDPGPIPECLRRKPKVAA